MRVAAFALLLAATPLLADEGELQLGGSAGVEATWLRHPLAGADLTIDERTAFAPLPRASLGTRIGITNELNFGSAFEAAGVTNVVTKEIVIGGIPGQVVTGAYLELAAPVGIFWRVDSGFDVSAILGVEIAPIVTAWTGSAFADPANVDAAGVPARLPIDVADAVAAGILVRASAAIDVRFGHIALRAVPYVAAAWTATPSARIGVLVEPCVLLSALPL